MPRVKRLVAAPAVFALLAAGCAHCKQCSDFPIAGPAAVYEGSYAPAISSGQIVSGPIVGPMGAPMGASPVVSTPGPFSAVPSTSDSVTPPSAGTGVTPLESERSGLSEPEIPRPSLPEGRPPASPPTPGGTNNGPSTGLVPNVVR